MHRGQSPQAVWQRASGVGEARFRRIAGVQTAGGGGRICRRLDRENRAEFVRVPTPERCRQVRRSGCHGTMHRRKNRPNPTGSRSPDAALFASHPPAESTLFFC